MYTINANILSDIIRERDRQEKKWGQQNQPILDPVLLDRSPQRMTEEYELPSEVRAKALCDIHKQRGDLTYMHVLVEEVAEAASAGDDMRKLRQELIQVAAVAVAMVESLDRNGR